MGDVKHGVAVEHPFHYRSGELVQAGDQITYNGERGTVEFVASKGVAGYEWYVERFPPHVGIMLAVPPFGSLFIDDVLNDEDLEFVGRGGTAERA